jgi:zinc protease
VRRNDAEGATSGARGAGAASGSALRVRRVPGAPVVAVRVVLAGGARAEEIPGTALIAGRALAEGTTRRDWRAIAAEAESRGTSVAGYGAFETTGVAVDALASEWQRALALAAELVFDPAFPAERLQWLTRQAGAELEALADEADVLTGRAFAELLYGAHPMGRPLQGSRESLARIDREACAGFHARNLARGGCVAVAGAIDEDAVAAELERLFGRLAAPGGTVTTPPAPPEPGARRREIRTRARDQAHLFVGQLTVERRHPDCAALELAAVALGAGSGLSGRIPNRIRDREGLAYHSWADAVAGAGLDRGRFVAYVGTAPASVARAERAIAEETRRLVDSGLTPREIAEARSYLLGREPFRHETARQWADLAALGEIEGLPLADPDWSRERIERTTDAEVEAALGRHLDADRLAVAVGLPGR